ncbi:hypothetical protein AB1I63_05155 [Streptococcus pneumoniae]
MFSQKSFGQIIREVRQAQGLSIEDVCGDEKALSVRQLIRLEQGVSRPTLTKIEYLANRFGIPAYTLMADYIALPQRYLDLKYLLMRISLFQQEEKIPQKEAYLTEIYETYYEQLPEDEQVATDILQSWIDVFMTKEPVFASLVLGDYFEQVQRKTIYETNDFLLLVLYFYSCYLDRGVFEEQLYVHFTQILLQQEENVLLEDCFLLVLTMIACIAAGFTNQVYQEMPHLLEKIKEWMARSQDYQYQAIVQLQEEKLARVLREQEK